MSCYVGQHPRSRESPVTWASGGVPGPRVGIFLGGANFLGAGSHLCGGCAGWPAGRRDARWKGRFQVRVPPAVSAAALSPAPSPGPRWPLEFFGNP